MQDAVNAAAGIDPSRGDVLTVTSLTFNQSDLLATQTAMVDAAQKEQLNNYLHLAALALGPLVMLGILFFILTRGRRKSAAQVQEGVLQVTIAPPQGLAGRPSSDRILQVAESYR